LTKLCGRTTAPAFASAKPAWGCRTRKATKNIAVMATSVTIWITLITIAVSVEPEMPR
jgi:hypothetical protein